MPRSLDETDARSPHPTKFSITNFKAFGATQEIPLAPITLIFGENSSGKSSIIQALGLIAQSFHGPGRALVPWKEEGLVDLGSLNSMIHASPGNDRSSRSMGFKLDFPIDTVVGVFKERLESIDGVMRALTSCRCDESFDLYFNYEIGRGRTTQIPMRALVCPASTRSSWSVGYIEQGGSINPEFESVNFGSQVGYKRELGGPSDRPDSAFISCSNPNIFDVMRGSAFEHAMVLMGMSREISIIKRHSDALLHGLIEDSEHPDLVQGILERMRENFASILSKITLSEKHDLELETCRKKFSQFLENGQWQSVRISVEPFVFVMESWNSAFQSVMSAQLDIDHPPDRKTMPDQGVDAFTDFTFSEFEEMYRAYSQRPWGVSRNYQYLSDRYIPENIDHEEEDRKARERTRPLIEACAQRHGRTIRDVVCAFSLGLVYRNAVEALIDPRCSLFSYGKDPQSEIRDSFRVVQNWSKSVSAVGPLRATPERMTRVRGEHYGSGVDPRGESIPELLYTKKRWLRRLNDWFERLGVPYEISPRKVGFDGLDAFEIRLIEKRAGEKNGIEVSWSDVGYGISQVIPVIMQSLLTRKGTILIEQPEIHLHPALQARLADLFIESACPSEGDDSSDRQFIIETHSEHLILRMIRRVREGTLDPADLSIVYVQRDGLESRVVPIRIDSRGKFLDPWPGGFFPERAEELFAKMPESDDESGTGDEA